MARSFTIEALLQIAPRPVLSSNQLHLEVLLRTTEVSRDIGFEALLVHQSLSTPLLRCISIDI